MMKNLFYLLLLLTSASYAQDQLFKKDNTKLEVKILEISQNEVKYKLFSYQEGPTIIIAKSDVALIIYQNGVHEVLSSPTQDKPTVVYLQNQPYSPSVRTIKNDSAEFSKLTSTKNIISTNILDPLNGSISISYMREFAHNYLNIYVPVSFGFTNPYFTQATNTLFSGNYNTYYGNYYNTSTFVVTDYKFNNKTFDVGLGLHFQTSGKHPVSHFIGPYVGMAQFTGTYTESNYYYDQNTGYSTTEVLTQSFVMNRLYVMLNNGLLFRITKNFNISMLAGIGYHVDNYLDHDPTKAMNSNKNLFPVNAYKFGLSFGYRF